MLSWMGCFITRLLANFAELYQHSIVKTLKPNMPEISISLFKFGPPHFGLATWRWIFYAFSISSPYLTLENTKKKLETFFLVWSCRCNTQYSPDMNRKIWGTSIIWGLPQNPMVSVPTLVERWTTRTLRVGPTGRYTRSQNP